MKVSMVLFPSDKVLLFLHSKMKISSMMMVKILMKIDDKYGKRIMFLNYNTFYLYEFYFLNLSPYLM